MIAEKHIKQNIQFTEVRLKNDDLKEKKTKGKRKRSTTFPDEHTYNTIVQRESRASTYIYKERIKSYNLILSFGSDA